MKRACCAFFFIVLTAGFVHAASPPDSSARGRVIMPFDSDWRFARTDATNSEKLEFADAGWRKLDVPHDWSIEGPFAQTNRTGGAGGFLPSGVGWYRKSFTLSRDFSKRHVSIEFDGVMANSDVWINGFHLGKRPFGYVSFNYDLTGHLNFGDKPNVIAVRADNSPQPASRWYSGAGIYRHVRLVVTDLVRVEPWGTFVTTPEVSAGRATVRVQSAITNQDAVSRSVTLRISLADPAGKILQTIETPSQTIPSGKSGQFSQDFVVKNPQRWDLENPVLYSVTTKVVIRDTVIDDEQTRFGIRDFKFDSATGFWLNGKNFRLNGVCLHHDASAFGAAVPLRAWERRLEALRPLGVNAIRTAHNPPAPEFLDACDRLGFLVMDEMFDCWTVAKNRHDYHLYFNEWAKIDTRDTVRRDRNHPSIILYSAGNEIHDTPRAELAKGILKGLVEVFHENDPTRPVTQGLFRPNVSHDYDNGLADMLDVIGTNYRDNEMLAAQRVKPERKIVGTEQRHDRQTWLWARDNPSHCGQFLWTGIDYLGESRRWPVVAAGSGLLDRTGTPRSLAYERQSWWSDKPMVHATRRVASAQNAPTDPGFTPLDRRQVLFPDWTPGNSDAHEENVEVYSNCEEVELFLNGKSLGSKPLNANASPRNWRFSFEPGILKAVAKNKNKIVATDELRTAGKPAKILLVADRSKIAADWDDVSYVSATIVDDKGVLVPQAADLISFKITGAGVVAAVDSGDNSSHEPFQASERRAFNGQCFALVKATPPSGKITLTATAPGLASGSIELIATAK